MGDPDRTARILVIDDTADNRDLFEQILEDDYEVLLADDGPSGLAAAREHSPDLVLLDVQMPGMDGYEVLSALRSDPSTREIPVLLVTARYRDADRVRTGLDLGAHDYITKPVEDEVLLAKVRAVLRGRGEEAARCEALAETARRQKVEALGILAGGVAHELNTPIQFVGDNLEFLAQCVAELLPIAELAARSPDSLDPGALASAVEKVDLEFLVREIPEAVEQAREGMRRIGETVRAMRKFANPGSGALRPVDVNEVVRTAATLTTGAWKPVAELSLELDSNLPPARGSAEELGQVVVNLLLNAAQAVAGDAVAERKGRIAVRTASEGTRVLIRVEDDGCGIDPAIRDRIFDPFFTTREVGAGSGQGLTVARSIVVDGHGGELTVESEPGSGSVFTIRLPTARSEASA